MTTPRLRLGDESQAVSLMAFGLTVELGAGRSSAVVGVSTRSRRRGVTDLAHHRVEHSGQLVCLVEDPEGCLDNEVTAIHLYEGEITFALWQDASFGCLLDRVPWRPLSYGDLASLNPGQRVHPYEVDRRLDEFEAMRRAYAGVPTWVARRRQQV